MRLFLFISNCNTIEQTKNEFLVCYFPISSYFFFSRELRKKKRIFCLNCPIKKTTTQYYTYVRYVLVPEVKLEFIMTFSRKLLLYILFLLLAHSYKEDIELTIGLSAVLCSSLLYPRISVDVAINCHTMNV